MVDLVRNDVGFDMAFVVKDANGNVVNLTSSTVTFKMSRVGYTETKASGICTLDTPTVGTCHYTFVAGDLDTVGQYNYELQIVYATKTITGRSTKLINVLPDLI